MRVNYRFRHSLGGNFVFAFLHVEPKLLQALWIARRKRFCKLGNFSLIRTAGNRSLFQRSLFGGLVGFLRTLRYRNAVKIIDPHVL